MNNDVPFSKRLSAYLLDVIFIYLVISFACNIRFLNPTYDKYMEYMEKYNSEKIAEGINGFKGYYAFIFLRCCVLESAIYGNATYIIPKENWEILSQKTKKELFDENKVIGKIDHSAKWEQNISDKFRMLKVALINN